MQCPEHPIRTQCVDIAIHRYLGNWGIPVHDGTGGYYRIKCCPNCGSRLR